MIGTSVPEYVFIRLCILGLRAVTPLSVFYLAFSIGEPPSTTAGKLLLTWCTFESAFWLLVYVPRKRGLQAAAQHPPVLDRQSRRDLFWKCWDKIPTPEYYIRRWFLDAKVEDVRRENVKDFFRWALLNKGDTSDDDKGQLEQQLPEGEEEELEEYVDGVQTLLGRQIDPGRGPAECLRLTIDRVKMLHRPLIWYMVVGLVDTLTSAYLRYSGFQLYRTSFRSEVSTFPFRLASLFTTRKSASPNLSYWYRSHTSRTRLPVVFIHGIGIGLYAYSQFLNEINKDDPLGPADGQIGIIAIELMPISFRITSPILGKQELCSQINMILEAHGWEKIVLASHSYGSVVTTHLLHSTSPVKAKIGPLVFIDPVTFLLHLPDVCYNFTARTPRRANEHQLHYFASTDMMVSHTLARHFFWADNILWKDDLRGRDATVALAGRDLIVDTESVGKYLAGIDMQSEDSSWKETTWNGTGIKTVFFPTCDHAQVFEKREYRRRLGDIIRSYADKRGQAAQGPD
ncbi:hypothetical protein M011DRAFT_407644 [Sporormia fimetaria CBS 119925]|uniref:AB hydrolase-1 domain-containing protein n=1 Tax=Sporormia fimetaria CBS 119925 TaxID=1340428 RepID=A0A6A6V426_9PLEO|nr:hypothetical protein M011DRAFT_407644 [Sporormia fimetaria CBS 119925]